MPNTRPSLVAILTLSLAFGFFGCASDRLPTSDAALTKDATLDGPEDDIRVPKVGPDTPPGADADTGADIPTDADCSVEICDGVDNDCDGQIDEQLVVRCRTVCGDGLSQCIAGQWTACDSPVPQDELCDGVDNDCDGATDEGLEPTLHTVSISDLTDRHPWCISPELPYTYCVTASHRWCRRQGENCYQTGVGTTSVDGPSAEILCLPSPVEVESASFEELTEVSGIDVTQDVLSAPVGQLVAHALCTSRGFEAGLGPLEYTADTGRAACVPSGLADALPISNADYQDAGCNIFVADSGVQCTHLSHQRCLASGYRAGFGPILFQGDGLAALCFP